MTLSLQEPRSVAILELATNYNEIPDLIVENRVIATPLRAG